MRLNDLTEMFSTFCYNNFQKKKSGVARWVPKSRVYPFFLSMEVGIYRFYNDTLSARVDWCDACRHSPLLGLTLA